MFKYGSKYVEVRVKPSNKVIDFLPYWQFSGNYDRNVQTRAKYACILRLPSADVCLNIHVVKG